MRNFSIIATSLLLSLNFSSQQVSACTEILLNKTPGITVSGRTLDYDSELGSKICFSQEGTKVSDPGARFTSLTGQPFSWTSKYNSVLVNAFNEPAYVDGMNAEGLSIACLWHNETQPSTTISPGTSPLSNVSVVQYIVENAKTVDEARKLFSGLSIVLSKYKGQDMLLHWIITEKSGKSLVVELKEGRPQFFDQVSQVGVLANSPSYDAQLANLTACKTAEQSNPSYNLPGDYHSRSRFVKSAYLVSHVPVFKSANDAEIAARQILHNVESPKGIQSSGSYTQWIAVRDQVNLRYWLMSRKEPAPKFVDLHNVDFKLAAGKTINVDSPIAGDLSSILQIKSAHATSSASSSNN